MTVIQAANAASYGLSVNKTRGSYRHGISYSIEKKIKVAECYIRLKEEKKGGRPNLSEIARTCSVSDKFVKKIEEELLVHGRVLTKEELKPRHTKIGPGANSLDTIDEVALLFLYLDEPSRSLPNYREELYHATGTIVSESTISRFFVHGFPIKGSMRQPNLIPYDKFKPENLA